jgi:hypothetical protein
MQVTHTKTQSTISRWSIAAAMFGSVCNVSFLILESYKDYCEGRVPSVWDWLNFPTAILLAPLLVLFLWRHLFPVVFIYASILFLILVWRVDWLKQVCAFKTFHKYDEPGLLLLFFGMISTAVVLVWATFRLVVFMRGALKSNSAKL